MLVNSKQLLQKARKGHYAVGGFNTCNLEITQAIIKASEELRAPVIVQISEKAITYAGLDNIADIVRNEALRVKNPVVLHLDHGRSVNIVKECLEMGFTSVMFDGSKLSFEENVKKTKEVVKLAKKYDAQVEGELGTVGGKEDYVMGIGNFTDPRLAEEFIEQTGVDSLAVAFGNAHGIPNAEEELNFEVLKDIAEAIKIPLVFHGASSTPTRDMTKAIGLGMSKINIDTDIRLAFRASLEEFIIRYPEKYDPRDIMTTVMKTIKKLVMKKIGQFGRGRY